MLKSLWTRLEQYLFPSPDEELIDLICDELDCFAYNFESDLRALLEDDPMQPSTNCIINVPFDISLWEDAVRKDLSCLKNDAPAEFDTLMNQLFDRIEGENTDSADLILNADLGLRDGDQHDIDYFSGFNGSLGYRTLQGKCQKYGMSFRMHFLPDNDGQHARIGLNIWSNNQRPLLNLLARPQANAALTR